MKARARVRTKIRKAAKWCGAVVTVLLLVLWIGSAWWYAGVESLWNRNGIDADAHHGTVSAGWLRPVDASGGPFIEWEFHRSLHESDPLWFILRGEWLLAHNGPTPSRKGLTLLMFPIWFPLVIVLAGTSLVWRADLRAIRRARDGLCAACGYDLSGAAAGAVCPECGKARSA